MYLFKLYLKDYVDLLCELHYNYINTDIRDHPIKILWDSIKKNSALPSIH